MSALSPVDLLKFVIRPALKLMEGVNDSQLPRFNTMAAEQLLVGTAAQESGGFLYLRQKGPGPALGIFQIEPRTFHDLWSRLSPSLRAVLIAEAGAFSPTPDMVAWNHRFGAMMARLKYRDDPNPLPNAGDIPGMAWAWKRGYNTVKGDGTVEEFISSWRRYVAPHAKEMWS